MARVEAHGGHKIKAVAIKEIASSKPWISSKQIIRFDKSEINLNLKRISTARVKINWRIQQNIKEFKAKKNHEIIKLWIRCEQNKSLTLEQSKDELDKEEAAEATQR